MRAAGTGGSGGTTPVGYYSCAGGGGGWNTNGNNGTVFSCTFNCTGGKTPLAGGAGGIGGGSPPDNANGGYGGGGYEPLPVTRATETLETQAGHMRVNGGAIAIGHPLGCSGARITATLLHEMKRRPEVKYGIATMCIGVGQGLAVIYERV